MAVAGWERLLFSYYCSCCGVRKATCGLAQSGYLALKQLEKNLEAEGYCQPKLTPGLWLQLSTQSKLSLQLCVQKVLRPSFPKRALLNF